MANTTTAPANKAVTYQGKPVREPSGAAKKAVTRKRAKRAIKVGMISEKAAKRHLGEF